ncbi:MAG: tetratricopeptide repeat-containing sensor histidine kinase [Saprospiraceae bacterium]|nr:tetratricopeptide repeat-containing sensor histidine kinase [Saprospiraceae bacterium]
MDSLLYLIDNEKNDTLRAHHLITLCRQLRTEFPELAFKYGLKSQEIYDKYNLNYEKCKLYNYLGIIKRNVTDYAASVEYFYKAVALAKEANCNDELAYAYNNLAESFLNIENKNESLEYYNLSNSIFLQTKNFKGLGFNLFSLGIYYSRLNEIEKAKTFFEKSLYYKLKYHDNRSIASNYLQIGRCYLVKCNFDSALIYFRKAEDLNEIANEGLYTHLYFFYGYFYSQKNEIDKAIQYFTISRDHSRTSSFYKNFVDCSDSLKFLYAKKGDFENYYKAHIESDSIRNVYYNNSYPDILKQSIVKYELEKLNQKIENDKLTENQKYQSKILAQKIVSIFLISLIILSIIFAYLFFKNSKIVNKINQVLILKNEEIKSKEIAIQTQNQQLNELNNTKDKFLSIVTHDLKNPFSGIVKLTDIALSNDFIHNKEKTEQNLNLIHTAAVNANKLLENLLSWSKSQTSKLEYLPQNYSLDELINENLNIVRNQIETKNIVLVNNISTTSNIFVDFNMINTVFRNILTNAVKFTRQNGKIEIYSTESEKSVHILFQDNGIGISKDLLPKLFSLNEKVFSKDTDGNFGTGLGLILCKEFVEKNNGEIWIESDEKEKFHFIPKT